MLLFRRSVIHLISIVREVDRTLTRGASQFVVMSAHFVMVIRAVSMGIQHAVSLYTPF